MAVDRRQAQARMLGLEGGSKHHERGRDRHAARGSFANAGVPKCIRSDNGPEFVVQLPSGARLAQVDVETLYIAPGSPWENGYAESFHSRLRDEFLALEVFENLSTSGRN